MIVGASTQDVFPARVAAGGAVRYGARVVEAFGQQAGLVVLDAPDAPAHDPAFEAHALRYVDGGTPLTFEIRPHGDGREMRVLSRPTAALTLDDVPAAWRTPDLLVLAPLLPDDLDMASFLGAQPRWTLVLAQGLLRAVAADGVVSALGHLPDALMGFARPRTVLSFSREETAGWAANDVEALVEAGALALLTGGSSGAEVIAPAERFHVEPRAATPLDTTGAGDVFATAFACALALGTVGSLRDAGRLAAQFAAASIETTGPAALPGVGVTMARAGLGAHIIDAGAA